MFLHDCVQKDASEAELFIVEAGPLDVAARESRDRLRQAVLVIDKTIACGDEIDEMLVNDPCQSIVATLGIRVQISAEEPPDLGPLRYRRIVVVTDPGPEGTHIRNEVLRYFSLYARPVLEARLVYVPEPGFTQEDFESRVLNPETRRLQVAS